MNSNDIALLRLRTQHIAGNRFRQARDLVEWMVALQAQDFAMSKWALGIRLPGVTEQMVDKALDDGEILRTHALRPTWHLVPAQDIRWILALTAPQIRTSMRSRDTQLGLTPAVISRCNSLIEKTLSDGIHLSRQELVSVLEQSGFKTEDNRAAHYLLHAELEGLICSGVKRNGSPTYALLSSRVPVSESPSRDQSLEMLAGKYFRSHGPATVSDFVWWSGLPVRDVRKALEMVSPDLISETFDSETYWFGDPYEHKTSGTQQVHLLPAYDEIIISYRNRKACLGAPHVKKVVSMNGFFRPVIIVNGVAAGLWKRSVVKDKIVVEAEYFQLCKKTLQVQVEEAAQRLGDFLGKEAEVKHGTC